MINALTLIVLLICHYVADFTHFVSPHMLKAKRIGRPYSPIFVHAGVHAILMGLFILLMYDLESAMVTFTIELCSHFWIDVFKGKLNTWYPKLSIHSNPWHWYIFGADQFFHILIIIFITTLIS